MPITLRATDEMELAAAVAAVDAALVARERSGETQTVPSRTIGVGLADGSGRALAVISVPGQYAEVADADAIEAGCLVLVFSDGIPVEHEVALKQAAHDAGVLVMGPDCASASSPASRGVSPTSSAPGRSGWSRPRAPARSRSTACSTLQGSGCASPWRRRTRPVGRGGRVGHLRRAGRAGRRRGDRAGAAGLQAAAPEVADRVAAAAAQLGVPVRSALLGLESSDLTAAVEPLLADLGVAVPAWPSRPGTVDAPAESAVLMGYYCGDTLADEAMLIAAPVLGELRFNTPLRPELDLAGDLRAAGHLVVDFGDNALTVGRAHPMIDPTLRLEAIAALAAGGEPAVRPDVVLGYGADPDPATTLPPALQAAGLPAVVALIGTEADPQGWSRGKPARSARPVPPCSPPTPRPPVTHST